jgi:hypothetical protein
MWNEGIMLYIISAFAWTNWKKTLEHLRVADLLATVSSQKLLNNK